VSFVLYQLNADASAWADMIFRKEKGGALGAAR
jgi:hypothetical protein